MAGEQPHDVLKDQPPGLKLAGDAADFPEQARTLPGQSGQSSGAAGSGAGEVLAGEAGAEDIDAPQVMGAALAHVGPLLRVGEAQGEDFAQQGFGQFA